VFKAKKTHFKDTLPVLGSIKGFREVDLKFEVNGLLESFNFDEGEMVEAGDIIANLSQRDALLKLEYRKIDVEKNETLFEIGAIARLQLEQSRLEYESAKNDFEKTNLYAPREGYLGRKHAEEGEFVTSNDKVATFVDIGSVYAEFGIIEKDMPKVSLRQDAEIFIDAYPGESYKGVVEQIAPLVEGKSRTQTLKVKLDNPENKLKPGMFARGIISTYEEENALIVPTTALIKKDTGFSVYVVHKEEVAEEASEVEGGEFGKIEVREVDIKYMASDYAEVAEGIAEDDLVAVEVREELKDESRIEISEIQESPF
jgi:membrane fusion protein (multidrug efflux system)